MITLPERGTRGTWLPDHQAPEGQDAREPARRQELGTGHGGVGVTCAAGAWAWRRAYGNSGMLQEPINKILLSSNVSPAPSTDKAPVSSGKGQALKAQTHFQRTGQKVELELRGKTSITGMQGQPKTLLTYLQKLFPNQILTFKVSCLIKSFLEVTNLSWKICANTPHLLI